MKAIDGDREEQLAEVLAHVRKARYMILTILDDEERLVVIRKGIPEEQLPDAMRHFATAVEQAEEARQKAARAEAAAEVFENAPPQLKSNCPACETQVLLVTPLPPPEVMRQPNIKARCVCSCGAFLVPYYVGEALALRLMTIDEIAETPDEIRNNMLGIRRRMANHAARQKAN